MSFSDSEPLFQSVIGFFLGLVSFLKGFSWLKQKRMIENTPTSQIRSIAMGLVEVYGAVLLEKKNLLKSPFSQKDCVYCKYTVEEYRNSKNGGHWDIIKRGEKMVPFNVSDSTGKVLVDANGSTVEIPMDFECKSGLGNDPPEHIKRFLLSNFMSFEGFFGVNKTLRYREYFIAPKDMIYVMGTAGTNPFADLANLTENAAGIMIQKGTNDKTYYISDRQEKQILSGLQWKIIGGVYGGGALAVGCFAIILYYLNII